MARDWLNEKIRDSLLDQSPDGGYRISGGFFALSEDVIGLDIQKEEMDENGSWISMDGGMYPLTLFDAQITLSELEQIVRIASSPDNRVWRLVQLRWEPMITVHGISVGLDGARVLLKQLQTAVQDAKLIEGYKSETP